MTVLRPRCKITIGLYEFDYVNSIQIESTWENLTDTGTLIIPKRVNLNEKPIVVGAESIFSVGDEIKIELGYFPNLATIFEGYVSAIDPRLPIRIEFQDKMWLLKQFTWKKSYSSVSLSTFVNDMIAAYESSEIFIDKKVKIETNITQKQEFGKVRLSDSSGAKALEYLRKQGVSSYFLKGVLNVGIAYNPDTTTEHIFKFQENIIADSLEYKTEDQNKIKVIARSLDKDHNQIEVEVGDKDGDVRTLYFYELSKDELTKKANEELPKLKYTGFRGSFTTFGEPIVNHGDRVKLINKEIPEYEGVYLVKKVNKSYGVNGYRQIIELDRKISES